MHGFALNILYILSIITDQHFVGHLVEQVWFGRTVYIGNKGPKHPYAAYLYLNLTAVKAQDISQEEILLVVNSHNQFRYLEP